jgi:predicted CXXCH cytochrome family protein
MGFRFFNRMITPNGSGYLLVFSLTVIVMLAFFGCSAVHRHKTLTFFFDGVPDTNGMQSTKILDSKEKTDSAGMKGFIAKADKPKIYYHEPFKERKCDACHDKSTMGKFLKPQPMLCYQCHDDFSQKFKVVHGPVGGGYCTACHNPHSGDSEKLLKRPGQRLCLYCHSSVQVMKNEMHKDIADANCTDCHNPHGGEDRTMLR